MVERKKVKWLVITKIHATSVRIFLADVTS